VRQLRRLGRLHPIECCPVHAEGAGKVRDRLAGIHTLTRVAGHGFARSWPSPALAQISSLSNSALACSRRFMDRRVQQNCVSIGQRANVGYPTHLIFVSQIYLGERMNITEEQAAHIYARACKAWYGPRAQRVVRKKIKQLEQQGDRGRVVAWTAVDHQLSRAAASELEARASSLKKPRPRLIANGNF
jgi:hypothetical protein